MGNNPLADEIVSQKHVRSFYQPGGPRPNNPVYYGGQDANSIAVTGVTVPEHGNPAPVWEPHPYRPGQYRMVGRSLTPPDLPKATFLFREKHGSIPRALRKQNCVFNVYQNVGKCKDLSDFSNGWSDYALVYSYAQTDSRDLGDRASFADDKELQDSLATTLVDVYPIGGLGFGEEAASQIAYEVLDLVYGSQIQCGDCGVPDDGTNWLYAITKSSGSTPGTAPKLIYSTDGGVVWTEATITGIGDIEDPQCVDIAGQYLIVGTRTAGGATTSGYYYSRINTDTGAPGTWTKVTTGFVATFQIYDIYVANAREVYFSADGGYVYKSTDVTAGVSVVSNGNATSTALRRIHGFEETVVAVGGAGVIIVSTNRGAQWATATASPVVATLQALFCQDGRRWWVGSATGKLYYTINGGVSWTEKLFAGSGAGQVRDIVFATDEAGYFSHDTTTPTARVFSTWNGGVDWTNSSPRLNGMPTYNRANRLAVPRVDDASVSANSLAVAGLAGNGTDGILLCAVASLM